MSLCINPYCPQPNIPENAHHPYCQSCSTPLLLLNRYWVTRLLYDNGGFADIYEVNDQGTLKILKILKPHLSNKPKVVELFQQEADVLSKLQCPGIPKVDKYFTVKAANSQQPLHCIVMEKVDGVNLQEWLQQRGNKPLSEEQALQWLAQLTQILAFIHQQQYFHRDIKPSNIMRRENGQLVLIDFGTAREMTNTYLAKVNGAQGGTGLGSPGYTPSEQEKGRAVLQSDFYGLGRTFVYLLTGKQPTDTVMYDVYNDELYWRQYTAHISSELADFIDRLMAAKAKDRPKDTDEILLQIKKIKDRAIPWNFERSKIKIDPLTTRLTTVRSSELEIDTLPAHPTPRKRSQPKIKWLVSSVVILFMALGGLGINLLFKSKEFSDHPVAANYENLSEAKSIEGHADVVDAVAFSPDRQTLASGSYDNTIKIWILATGKELRTLNGHSNFIFSVAFSPDGKKLVSGSADNTIKIWNIDNGEEIYTLKGHSDKVFSVAFSPDGKTLASGSYDNNIKIWNVSTGQQIRTLTGHSDYIRTVAFSPDGESLASGSDDKTIKIWNVATGQLIRTLIGHSNSVFSVAFRDRNILASGSRDKTIKLWNIATGKPIKTISGSSGWIDSIAFSPASEVLAAGISGSDETNIKLWNVATGQLITSLSGNSTSIGSVAFSPDGRTLATGSGNNIIQVWQVGDR